MSRTTTPNRENSPAAIADANRQQNMPLDLEDNQNQPPEPVSQNVESIKALRTRAEQEVSRNQRAVESITAFFGRPAFLYSILVVMFLWVTPNILPRRFHIPRFDPSFNWLERTVTLSSFLVTTGVLIKQERQAKIATRRDHLILQMGLLSEQKTAKLIALIEELRRDIPNVKDRHDVEAEVMQQSTDPHTVMDILEAELLQEIEELRKP